MTIYRAFQQPILTKKGTIEACHTLSIFELNHKVRLCDGIHIKGTWALADGETVLPNLPLRFELMISDMGAWIRLQYLSQNYKIYLEKTPCNFGGYRWWFICGLMQNGRICGRRVAKIHLPPNQLYFGCRHCYNLTYKSCQQSNKTRNRLKKLPIEEALEMFQRGEIDIFQIFKMAPQIFKTHE